MYFKPDLFVVRTMVHYVRIRQYRIRIHACLRMAMPTTHRTNDHTTHSLALTNGSTFGELLLLPSLLLLFVLFITNERRYLLPCISILLLHIPDSSIYLFNFIRSFIHTFVLLLPSILFVLFITKVRTNEDIYYHIYLSYYFIFQIYHVKN